ncbi:MAG TPA: hypothetical protein VE422_30550 [Terriglobia bacterium]|nr:hypothetical protein [Terriglobia bacterium]
MDTANQQNLSPEQARTDELLKRYAALDKVSATVKQIQRYSDMLASIPEDQLTPTQRLWQLAHEAVNAKFAPGTEESMLEGAICLYTLESCIPAK